MLVCMHEENVFKNNCCCCPFDACIYYLTWKRTSRWLGHAGVLQHSVFSSLLRAFWKDRWGYQQQQKFKVLSLILSNAHFLRAAFRIKYRCFVINLKWVKYTGPHIVHSCTLRNIHCDQMFSFFPPTDLDWIRVLINNGLFNMLFENLRLFAVHVWSWCSTLAFYRRLIFL